ncbi:hypothetical protein GOP47_0027497, partial [Adiantum capillus-veneris]
MVVAIITLSSGSRCPDSVYVELHVFVCGHVDLGHKSTDHRAKGCEAIHGGSTA